jgi:hypothetical protein
LESTFLSEVSLDSLAGNHRVANSGGYFPLTPLFPSSAPTILKTDAYVHSPEVCVRRAARFHDYRPVDQGFVFC